MGNIMSTRLWNAETQSLAGDGRSEQTTALFLSDIDAEPAAWASESKCVTIQRFLGWLPDSAAEKLKQNQPQPIYVPCVVSVQGIVARTTRTEAIVLVQRVFRRYRVLRKWHVVGFHVLELARSVLDERAAAEDEEELLSNFRQILSSGFSAQKVSITGALKNIQLQLVLKANEGECYLTWTPSRKRHARIPLHDIQEVVPVLRDGNKHAPRLANKVSHRRGLIIVCKSHHRGRVVLQMGSKRERKILLLGFQRLLSELNRFDPMFDAAGTMRKGVPRRQSAIQFFDPEQRTDSGKLDVSERMGSNERADPNEGGSRGDGSRSSVSATDSGPLSPVKPLRRNSIERLYETRFDDNVALATNVNVSVAGMESKDTEMRRSSVVM